MRGATLVRLLLLISRLFQSTRPMRGATPEPKKVITPLKFQSTRPMRGATIMDWFGDTFFIISIHAPHAGRDEAIPCQQWLSVHFNPRAPCGARQFCTKTARAQILFQSTRPMRGATLADARLDGQERFQSTRPMRGATSIRHAASSAGSSFQSTRPMRGATSADCFVACM